MAKTKPDTDRADLERLVDHDISVDNQTEAGTLDMSDHGNFNIKNGYPLPNDFINPPFGDEKHLCVDLAGNYNKKWFQLLLERTHDRQQNPQPFPLGGREWRVYLDTWCDVPPEIIESLKKAVETHHSYNRKPQEVEVGIDHGHTTVERKRFNYDKIPSA